MILLVIVLGVLTAGETGKNSLVFLMPLWETGEKTEYTGWESFWSGVMPVLFFREEPVVLQTESNWTREQIIQAEGQDEHAYGIETPEPPETSAGRYRIAGELALRLQEENQRTVSGEGTENVLQEEPEEKQNTGEEVVPEEKREEAPVQQEFYQWEYYETFDRLVKDFYAVDASTVVDESLLNLEALLEPDLSIEKRTDDQPQILIYHTHSQEGFADSVEGDPSTTIMGVGQVLARILEDTYGYNVMHHLGQYDVENRDYAYNTALPYLEQLLAEYPTIEVVIDLHRDEMAESTRLVTDIEGRPTARFMFFNGLSRTRKHGDIEYLPNENIEENLAFSFQMQALCNQYYPGLTRRIYLKGYRYNMHLKARYLLVEMGAQNNTYQECYNACIPLARMLDLELSGAEYR